MIRFLGCYGRLNTNSTGEREVDQKKYHFNISHVSDAVPFSKFCSLPPANQKQDIIHRSNSFRLLVSQCNSSNIFFLVPLLFLDFILSVKQRLSSSDFRKN